MDNQAFIIQSLYEIQAIQFGDFTLKSGQKSSIYLNLRKIISYPKLLRVIASAMWEKIKHQQFDLICGVPYTALPIATCLSLEHNLPMIMRRKEKKEYGTKQLIEGVFSAGQRCLIVEDVVTTGSSIIETAQDLQAEGLVVKDIVALVDREQSGKENLEKHFNFSAVLRFSEIFDALLASSIITDSERDIIQTFVAQRIMT